MRGVGWGLIRVRMLFGIGFASAHTSGRLLSELTSLEKIIVINCFEMDRNTCCIVRTGSDYTSIDQRTG